MDLGIRWLPVEAEPQNGRPSRTLEAEVVPTVAFEGAPGLLHGGIAATLLDECMGALSHVLDRHVTVTANLAVKYRLPVPLDGTTLRVESWRDRPELRRRNRLHGRLFLADGRVAVEAAGLFVDKGPLPRA